MNYEIITYFIDGLLIGALIVILIMNIKEEREFKKKKKFYEDLIHLHKRMEDIKEHSGDDLPEKE